MTKFPLERWAGNSSLRWAAVYALLAILFFISGVPW